MSIVPLPKIITIIGPTASGKTSLGVFLAKKFNGEIISADSRQVYRGLDLGTGKEGKEGKEIRWLEGVPQYLIDVRDPEEKFNVYDFKEMAEIVIEDMIARNRQPFIVGGTGLYVDGLVKNYDFAGRDQKKKNRPKYQVLQIGIEIPRPELYRRIDQRVNARLKQGMLEEVKGLLDREISARWLISLGLEYKYLTEHLIGKIPDKNQAIQKLKFATHAFARRQETWFRHHGQIEWVGDKQQAFRLVGSFLKLD